MLIIAEYIWLDITNHYRSKTKIFNIPATNDRETASYLELATYPVWNYDGSSTGDIPNNLTGNTECLLYPIALFDDPFNTSTTNIKFMLVLCNNSYILEEKEVPVHPIMFNHYKEIMNILDEEEYMLGFEQEFFILDKKTLMPIGIHNLDNIIQGQYYCGNGSISVNSRQFISDSQKKLLKAGISLTGFNYEVAPGQAEFQVCDYGIEALLQLLITRFILIRNAEKYNLLVSFENVISTRDNINNSGCHTNISNAIMRQEGGMETINEKINELGKNTPKTEAEFNNIFGEGNTKRLIGKLETSNWREFTWGKGTRHTSIRIPNQVVKDGYGYFEDRRPGANMNPFNYIWHLLISV